jgi:hypothetical protein
MLAQMSQTTQAETTRRLQAVRSPPPPMKTTTMTKIRP